MSPDSVFHCCILFLFVSYGCCQDGVTAAWGPDKEGCVEHAASAAPAALAPTVSKTPFHLHVRAAVDESQEAPFYL